MQMSRMNHPRVPVPPVSEKEQGVKIVLSVKEYNVLLFLESWRPHGVHSTLDQAVTVRVLGGNTVL